MRIGSHDAQVLDGLSIQGEVGCPAVTLAGVHEHTSIAHVIVILEVSRIEQTVVGTLEVRPVAGILLDVPVHQAHVVDLLRVGELSSSREGEADGQLIVNGDA